MLVGCHPFGILHLFNNNNFTVMPQSFSNTNIHIIFGTKYRQQFIDNKIESQLFEYIGQVVNNLNCQNIIVGGYRDHVHILCKLYRPLSQSTLVKEIKANSSLWMKTQGIQYENFYWQDGYAVFSVSQSDLERVITYIQNQREHHQKQTFQKEYLKFLEEHRIEYDKGFIWH